MQKNLRPLNKFLTLNGADTDPNMAVSTGAFEYVCPVGLVAKVEELIISLQDVSIAIDFFGGVPALSTGLSLKHTKADTTTVLNDLLDGVNIKSGHDLARLGEVIIVTGRTTDTMYVCYRLNRPLVLLPTEKLRTVITDTLAGLVSCSIFLKGHAFDEELL